MKLMYFCGFFFFASICNVAHSKYHIRTHQTGNDFPRRSKGNTRAGGNVERKTVLERLHYTNTTLRIFFFPQRGYIHQVAL